MNTPHSLPGLAPGAGELSGAEMDGSKEGASRELELRPHGAWLRLNSRRLTAAQLRQISHALNLLTQGSCYQLRQCIEGHLDAEGHEAHNMLVVMHDAPDGGTTLKLADCEGT